ncbi:hypothetical protein ACHAWF_001200 [Thalassiosira exigua]
MTSTHLGVEKKCDYGKVLEKVMILCWNLCISHPKDDIISIHNNVKSCFRLLKHHPDVIGAFCSIIAGILYAPTGLTIGSDFRPSTQVQCKGVLDKSGSVVDKPHNMFVDDDIIMDVYKKNCLEQVIAAGIEVVFIVLEESQLELRQDSVSWDKLSKMLIH